MSVDVRIRNGMTNAEEGDVVGIANDLITQEGVVDLDGGHCLVHETAPTGMTVEVDAGVVYVPYSAFDPFNSNTVRFYQLVVKDDTNVLNIDSNSSGSTRIDLICAKMDIVTVPDDDANNVGSLIVVKGTPGAGAPATPANHIKLAQVTVANGASSIENANIADYRVQALLNSDYINPADFITADGVATLENKTYLQPIIEKWDGWDKVSDTWSYSSIDGPTNVVTVPSGAANRYGQAMRVKLTQSRAYTNDPGSGSNITLNMSVTQGFKVGDTVTVSSSAGSEEAVINLVTTNTSIRVASLSINHTNVDPLVTMTKYFIVTKVADTALTMYGGTLFELANSTISNIYVSSAKSPLGFPMDPTYWTEVVTDGTDRSKGSPTAGSWYNISQLNISMPIGVWNLSYKCSYYATRSTDGVISIFSTVSTANNTESDPNSTAGVYFQLTKATVTNIISAAGSISNRILSATSKTQLYFNIKTTASGVGTMAVINGTNLGEIRLVCALL